MQGVPMGVGLPPTQYEPYGGEYPISNMDPMGLMPVGSYYSAPPPPSYAMNTMTTNKRPYDDGYSTEGKIASYDPSFGLGSVSMLAKKARPGGEGLAIGGQQATYPQRPGEKECAYFMKHGSCSYGASCRFDHPLWVPSGGVPGWKENTSGVGGSDTPYPERPGEVECAFYMRHGECKFGVTCKFHHPKERAAQPLVPSTKDVTKTVAANGSSRDGSTKERGSYGKPSVLSTKGLPIRPGETDCSYYLKTGGCKFGAMCKFNHPENNPGIDDYAVRAQMAQQPTSWPAAGQMIAAQHPQMIPATWAQAGQIAMPTAQLLSDDSMTADLSARTMCNMVLYPASHRYEQGMLGVEIPMNPQNQLSLTYAAPAAVATSYPERPGQPDCQFFLRNGECKFGASCKFHHPRKGAPAATTPPPAAAPPGVKLTKAGLPRRPGETVCAYYMKTATCKYGPQCKFDHPPPGEAAALAAAAAKEVKEDGTGEEALGGEDGTGVSLLGVKDESDAGMLEVSS